MSYLGVRAETIERYKLTSEQVALEMAAGALHISRANVALANTGLAGPSGGDGSIPVGTVCFAWAFERGGEIRSFSETRKFNGDRNAVRQAATEYLLSRTWHYHNALESHTDQHA